MSACATHFRCHANALGEPASLREAGKWLIVLYAGLESEDVGSASAAMTAMRMESRAALQPIATPEYKLLDA